MLAIVVVNQSIMGRPPLQGNELSTRTTRFSFTLRQSPPSHTKWTNDVGNDQAATQPTEMELFAGPSPPLDFGS
jgi:hypothetical protein